MTIQSDHDALGAAAAISAEPCALCLRLLPLRISHVIPNAYFRHIKRSGSGYLRHFEANPTGPITNSIDSWSEPLLCEDCEKRFGAWETIWIQRLRKTATHFHQALTAIDVDKYDFHTLRGFLLSILWRAGVSKQKAFERVQIDARNLEQLRRALLDEETLPEGLFAIRIRKLVDTSDIMKWDVFAKAVKAPYRFETAGLKGYRFDFAGYLFDFLFPKRSTKRQLALPGIVRDASSMKIPSVDVRSLPDFTGIGAMLLIKKLREGWRP